MAIRRVFISLACGLVLSQALPSVAQAQSPEVPTLVADLEGTPIPATSAADYHCHDFDYPLIHCFSTSEALEASVSGWASGTDAADTASLLAVDYVRIYEFASHGGTSFIVSQDYSNLGTIGWNNRISSYRGLNLETGSFYTDTVYAGTIDSFCCNESVTSLSSTYDNQFSSVKRT